MSTRAIIWFRGNDSDANEHGTFVYAHDGGDPRFVLKDLKEAHDRARTPRPSKVHPDSYYDDSWKLGRPGYSASLLCGVDPPNFQVDTYWLASGGQFYADLEWIYIVTAEVVDRQWTWFVEVRVPGAEFCNEPTLENTRILHRRQPIEKLARRYLKRKQRRRQTVAAGGGTVTTRIPAQDLAVLGRANPDAVGHFKTEMTTGRSTLFYGYGNQTLYTDARPKGTHNVVLSEHPEIIEEIVPPEVYQRYRAGEFFDPTKGGQAWEMVAAFALLGRLGGIQTPGGHYNVVSIWPRSLAGVPGKLEPIPGLLDRALPGLLEALKGDGRVVSYGTQTRIDDDWIVVVEGELDPITVREYLAGHAG